LSSAVDVCLPADAPYDEVHRTFLTWTPDDIGRALTALGVAVRAGRHPVDRPYRHVNGFTKVVATRHPSGARLTLHYWPPEPGTDEDVSRAHSHRFPFASHLLGGEQHFRALEETQLTVGSERFRRYIYRPYLGGRIASVSSSGEFGLRMVRMDKRSPLDGYYDTNATDVHQAVTRRQSACATLVLRGPREQRTSKVYYPAHEPAPRGGLQLGRALPQSLVIEQVEHAIRMVSSGG
jgi:hypothetical protein